LAAKMYDQAANNFEMDNQAGQANSMRVKWADLQILVSTKESPPDFAKVIKTYEKVGMKQLQQSLAKGLAKDYFFKCGLCYLANQDMVGVRSALQNYFIEDPSFENDRKGKFLVKLADYCEAGDRDLFGRLVAEYQRITPFDKIQTKLVVRVKQFYAPEQETALTHAASQNQEIDLVGGDDDNQQTTTP